MPETLHIACAGEGCPECRGVGVLGWKLHQKPVYAHWQDSPSAIGECRLGPGQQRIGSSRKFLEQLSGNALRGIARGADVSRKCREDALSVIRERYGSR